MTIRPGEFWVADISFTDGSASKRRPVLVLWLAGDDVVVAAITPSSQQPTMYDPSTMNNAPDIESDHHVTDASNPFIP